MDAREQHHVVSVSARPSSWPLVGWYWPWPAKGVNAAILADLHDNVAACAADSVAECSACQPLATADTLVASNRAASTAPIQSP